MQMQRKCEDALSILVLRAKGRRLSVSDIMGHDLCDPRRVDSEESGRDSIQRPRAWVRLSLSPFVLTDDWQQ